MLAGLLTLKFHHQFLFTVLVAAAVVIFWWGIWGVLDDYFLPKHPCRWLRYLAAVGLGILILIASHYGIQALL